MPGKKHPIRKSLGHLARHLDARAAVSLSRLFGSRRQKAFGILMYHRIAPITAGAAAPTWNVTPERFRSQIAGLLKRGYEPWPLRSVLECRRDGWPIPRNAFVVTFDDGYANVYHHAWPVLKEFRVPATVFLATACLDSKAPFACDDWQEAGSRRVPAESWRPLSTGQCVEMFEEGLIDLGTHSHTHVDFRGRSDRLFRELQTSLAILRSRFGLADVAFAFPFGITGKCLTRAARMAGVLCGLTVQGKLVTPSSDPLGWGRFEAEATDSAATLAAKLDGWYGLVRNALPLKRRRLTGIDPKLSFYDESLV